MKDSNLVRNLIVNYRWLKERKLIKGDVVVGQLCDPMTIVNGRKLVSFCSNNYLGLSKRREVLRAAKKAVEKYGIGTCESRKLGGGTCNFLKI